MVSKPVRNLHSEKEVPPHWCSVLYDEEKNMCWLERKDKKSRKREIIPWDDVRYQVESFLKEQQNAK